MKSNTGRKGVVTLQGLVSEILWFLHASHLADVESSVFEILCQHRRRVSAVKTRRSHPRIAATSRDNHLESNRQHRNIY